MGSAVVCRRCEKTTERTGGKRESTCCWMSVAEVNDEIVAGASYLRQTVKGPGRVTVTSMVTSLPPRPHHPAPGIPSSQVGKTKPLANFYVAPPPTPPPRPRRPYRNWFFTFPPPPFCGFFFTVPAHFRRMTQNQRRKLFCQDPARRESSYSNS